MSEYTTLQILEMIEANGGPRGLDLSGKDLSRIDLGREAIETELQKRREKNPDVEPLWWSEEHRSIHLAGANLLKSDLNVANLRGADLRGADLRGADLREADLREADLREADLREAGLHGTDLRGATVLPEEQARLAGSLANEASVLYERGDAGAAMALLKEQECICRDLGDQAGVAGSLNKQASILFERGDAGAAMALLKEQERIYRKLGDEAGVKYSLDRQLAVLLEQGHRLPSSALLGETERLRREFRDQGAKFEAEFLLERSLQETEIDVPVRLWLEALMAAIGSGDSARVSRLMGLPARPRRSVSKISVAHPRLLSKRFASKFLVHLYQSSWGEQVESRARGIFGQGEFQVVVEAVRFVLGQEVEIELQSPEIEFSNAVVRKRLTEPVTEVIFIGKPRESCVPGHKHPVLLLVRDTEKGCELKSISFDVKVVDYAIDHVSRPRLQQVSAGLSGLGAVALFILTLLQQVETSFGLTSGTAAAVLAAGIYTRFAYMFRQPGSTATTR